MLKISKTNSIQLHKNCAYLCKTYTILHNSTQLHRSIVHKLPKLSNNFFLNYTKNEKQLYKVLHNFTRHLQNYTNNIKTFNFFTILQDVTKHSTNTQLYTSVQYVEIKLYKFYNTLQTIQTYTQPHKNTNLYTNIHNSTKLIKTNIQYYTQNTKPYKKSKTLQDYTNTQMLHNSTEFCKFFKIQNFTKLHKT